MCGIVGAVNGNKTAEVLMAGLERLEYRGYDSAGMALVDNEQQLQLHKKQGKVSELEKAQALMAESGETNVSLAIDVLNKSANVTAAQIIQANLAAIGVTLEIRCQAIADTNAPRRGVASIFPEGSFAVFQFAGLEKCAAAASSSV